MLISFFILLILLQQQFAWCLEDCQKHNDPYLSRILVSELHNDPCYKHLANITNEFGISTRIDPVVWSNSTATTTTTTTTTKDNNSSQILTQKQIEFYKNNGYLVLHNFFNQSLIDKWNDISKKIDSEWNDSFLNKSTFEYTSLNNKNDSYYIPFVNSASENGFRSLFSVHNTIFSQDKKYLHENDKIIGIIEEILGSKVYISQSRMNYQRAMHGEGFIWHSDFETWHNEDGMPKPRALSLVVALEDTFAYNGGLMVIPQSHKYFVHCFQNKSSTIKQGKEESEGEQESVIIPKENWKASLRGQYYGTPSKSQLFWLYNQTGIEYIQTLKGGLFLFDSNLIHGSHSNIAPIGRNNAFFVYNSVENRLINQPYANKRAPLRPNYLAVRDDTKGIDAKQFENDQCVN